MATDYITNAGNDNEYGPWSIGIYKGFTPFDLADPEDIINPVLTSLNVIDVDAGFLADPFMLYKVTFPE